MSDEIGLVEAEAVSEIFKSTTLKEFVRLCIERYFEQLDGGQAANLHELVIKQVEAPLLETVLKHVRGNQSKAAQLLGLSRGTLRKKLCEHGIA